METESRKVVAGGWEERGIGSCHLMGVESQFCKMESILEMENDDVCTKI